MEKKSIYLLSVLCICGLVCILPVAGEDTTPPAIVSTYPAANDVHIPIDISAITITFNEEIQWNPNTMSVHLWDWEWVDVPIGVISISADGKTLIIHAPTTPTPWLENWAWSPDFTGIYDVQVNGVKDLAGNDMDGQYSFHFYTVPYDTTPPSVISISPIDGACNIGEEVIITANMSEKINQCSGTVEIKDSNGNLVALSDDDAPYGYHTDNYIDLVITPAAPLTSGETYTVTIQGIKDEYAYVMDTYSWSFTVGDPSPVISVSAMPNVLWPPNHKYVDVAASVSVSDVCDDPAPSVELVSVTSNEPEDAIGMGDGNTINDIFNVDTYHFKLRAERQEAGIGRIYTITYMATDSSGNIATAFTTVSVPVTKK